MSDEKIFFDEQALSVVDSWLGGNTVKANRNAPRVSSSSVVVPLSKIGLGFRGKVSEEKIKDALQTRLDKNQKKKKKKDTLGNDDSNKRKIDTEDDGNDDDDSDLQLHGIVEDTPISRTQQVSKVVEKYHPKKKTAVDLVVSAKSSVALLSNIDPTSSVADNSTQIAAVTAESSSKAADSDGYKRKRTKTRSKQKNIRRDNRPDSQKPSYITNTEAEDYRGRELTEVIKLLSWNDKTVFIDDKVFVGLGQIFLGDETETVDTQLTNLHFLCHVHYNLTVG